MTAFYTREGLKHILEVSAFVFVLVSAVADMSLVLFFNTYGVFLGPAVTLFPLALMLSLAIRAQGVFNAATATAAELNVRIREREEDVLAGQMELRIREQASLIAEERSRIMRDMHDGIGGQLAGLLVRARTGKLPADVLTTELEDSLDDLRLLIDLLDQGMDGSLAYALGAFRSRLEPKCEAAGVELVWGVEDVGATPDIGPDRTLHIYRMVQEACSNALRHSRSGSLTVGLRRDEADAIEVFVEDCGIGFDPGATVGGRGLDNLRMRAARVRGELSLSTSSGGCRVSLKLRREAAAGLASCH